MDEEKKNSHALTRFYPLLLIKKRKKRQKVRKCTKYIHDTRCILIIRDL